MSRGGARPGAGRKAVDRPTEPLLTYSFTVRLSDLGVLNRLGRGNHSLGLRRLIDQHRARTNPAASTVQVTDATPLPMPQAPIRTIRSDDKDSTQYG